jgi:hypothetical protein
MEKIRSETERAILILNGKICKDTTPDEALKYTQAAVNLANMLNALHE